MSKRINKFGEFNSDIKSYTIGSPLIAQLGKNYTNNLNRMISGDELMKLALDNTRIAQQIIGGKTVYLECENKER